MEPFLDWAISAVSEAWVEVVALEALEVMAVEAMAQRTLLPEDRAVVAGDEQQDDKAVAMAPVPSSVRAEDSVNRPGVVAMAADSNGRKETATAGDGEDKGNVR